MGRRDFEFESVSWNEHVVRSGHDSGLTMAAYGQPLNSTFACQKYINLGNYFKRYSTDLQIMLFICEF